jgi:DUF218 domain
MIRKIILTIAICLGLWIAGFFYYLYYINSYIIGTSRSDAIAVVAGGQKRLETALQLLKQAYAPILFITGVSSQSQLSNFLKENNVSQAQVIYGTGGYDTEDAVSKIANFINSNSIKSLRLVTTSYNMPATLSALASKIHYDAIIIPHPVFPSQPSYMGIFAEYNRYLYGAVISK